MDDAMDDYPRWPCSGTRIFMDDEKGRLSKMTMLRYNDFHG